MSRSKVKQSQRINHLPTSYAAVRSKNEIYYQMASIFKQITPGRKNNAAKIFKEMILTNAA